MKTALLPRQLCEPGEWGNVKVICIYSEQRRTRYGRLIEERFCFFHRGQHYECYYKYNSRGVVVESKVS